MEHKSKFNKSKCATCKYHGKLNNGDGRKVHCYYVGSTGRACLRRVGKEVIDIRGNDFNNCLIYEKGANK